MEETKGSAEPLEIKTAIQIAKILATAPEERLPMIMDVFSKAQVDIAGLEDLEEWRALRHTKTIIIDPEEFIEGLIRGAAMTAGEYRIKADDFNDYCKRRGVSPRSAKKTLAQLQLIRTGTDAGKTNYTMTIWDEETKAPCRCVCIRDPRDPRCERFYRKED